MTEANIVKGDSVAKVLDSALDAGEGLLRLTPTWVPRSFLHPGKRIRLHPDDYYAYGADRGGIDERWFASTTDAANEGRMGKLNLQTPVIIHFGQHTEDEVFITHEAATAGVEIENTGSEPLVSLRYFGPDTHPSVPNVGDYR
jgi:hypothetical protein